ncbi:MAG: phytanoyl-CoA dioxygenase family protein [Candidatus Omnitrophica bacterium]|nr:phytanoyl-CoA dioxygenase family protein [Candidatus Omnitrophota bacterium]MCA9425171.1 phytanoyl-CoA dioxygenase family protein [Candidatus Omnitrophota bacterium]
MEHVALATLSESDPNPNRRPQDEENTVLTAEQIESFNDQGFLRIPRVFTPEEMDRLDEDLEFIIQTWATESMGWTGPWRKVYMDESTEKASKLISIHDLYFYSSAWMRAVTKPDLVSSLSDLMGPNIELHHSTLHAKPPETGHPFPMHQDSAFYLHQDGRYLDVLVHLDDTSHENGEIRFLSGSHKLGHLDHITQTEDGPCTPHLPTTDYSLEDTVPVPAKRGDVVVFNVFTIHGSHINQTDRIRRMVRVGYRDPENKQVAGQSLGRPGLMVCGRRPRLVGDLAFSTEQD